MFGFWKLTSSCCWLDQCECTIETGDAEGLRYASHMSDITLLPQLTPCLTLWFNHTITHLLSASLSNLTPLQRDILDHVLIWERLLKYAVGVCQKYMQHAHSQNKGVKIRYRRITDSLLSYTSLTSMGYFTIPDCLHV